MIISLILFTFVLNGTSGYIRLFFPKGSRARIRCLYIPITFAILQRYIFNLSYEFLPIFLVTALIGLYIGGSIHRYRIGLKEEEKTGSECP